MLAFVMDRKYGGTTGYNWLGAGKSYRDAGTLFWKPATARRRCGATRGDAFGALLLVLAGKAGCLREGGVERAVGSPSRPKHACPRSMPGAHQQRPA